MARRHWTVAWRAPLAVASTIVYWATTLPLDIIGAAVAVPLAILFGKEQPDITGTKTIYSAPKWLWLWGNQQDGYDPEWAVQTIYKGWSKFRRRYSWAAWRNRTSNLRFLGLFKPTKPIQEIRGKTWHVQWSGWLTEWFWDHPSKSKFTKFGARLGPEWTKEGTNFAFRLYARY